MNVAACTPMCAAEGPYIQNAVLYRITGLYKASGSFVYLECLKSMMLMDKDWPGSVCWEPFAR